jgi:ubiquinol-cytochrome c reductase cytochrome b subunit
VLLGGLAQINPIWLWGPYHAQDVSSFAQPDWYVGWLEGTLRLFPAWRLSIAGYEVPVAFWPAVVFPLVTFAVLYAWPAIERFFTGDIYIHNVLERPRDRPVRTGICVGALTLYVLVFVAGGQDVLAYYLQATQPPVTLALRGICVGLPIVTGTIAWWVCRGLAAAGRLPVTEPPQGSAESATPPLGRYLPDRAWVESTDGQQEQVSRPRVMARGAAIVSGLVAAWLAKRRQRARSAEGPSRSDSSAGSPASSDSAPPETANSDSSGSNRP